MLQDSIARAADSDLAVLRPATDAARSRGRLTVVAGPMFSGKTTELVRLCRRARVFRNVQVFKHESDVRYDLLDVVSHDGVAEPSIAVRQAADILDRLDPAVNVVAIDEGQHFGPELYDVVHELRARAIDVIVAALCVTFDQRPFSPIPELMAVAEDVHKLTAVCKICGQDAPFHIRIAPTAGPGADLDPSYVGDDDAYTARCFQHIQADA
jgi:thymidine kinase